MLKIRNLNLIGWLIEANNKLWANDGKVLNIWNMKVPCWSKMSELDFRRFWASRESCVVQQTHIHVGSTCICPILVCKTGRRLFQSPCGVHCTRRGTFQNPCGTRTGSCYTGPKSQQHTENRENACDSCIAVRWFRTDVPRTTKS